jgi:shikimate kinase
MNIVLIGMRGSGKTTVGEVLAEKLGRELVEMDRLITQRMGLTIPEIVDRYGWARFRAVEEDITSEVARLKDVVIAAGGGVVTSEKNISELKRNGILVWLIASMDSLLKRIGEDATRPPLLSGRTQREDMEITLAERESLYQKAAELVVDTDNKKPEEVAEAIIGLLMARGELA